MRPSKQTSRPSDQTGLHATRDAIETTTQIGFAGVQLGVTAMRESAPPHQNGAGSQLFSRLLISVRVSYSFSSYGLFIFVFVLSFFFFFFFFFFFVFLFFFLFLRSCSPPGRAQR